MLNESQDCQPIKEHTTELDLEPRTTSQAVTASEGRNDTPELGPPQADIYNGNDQIVVMSSQEPGSTDQGAQSSPTEGYVLGCVGQQTEDEMEPQSQEVIDGNVQPADMIDEILLLKIRGMLIAKLRQAGQDRVFLDQVRRDRTLHHFLLNRARRRVDGTLLEDRQLIMMLDFYGADRIEIPEPIYWSENTIYRAWPETRDVAGIRQYIVENDGDKTKTQAHWLSYPRWPSLLDRDTPYDTIERTWLEWCRAARNNLQKEESGTVDNSYSGLRYRFKGKIVYCVLGEFKKRVQGFPISLLACALSFEEPFRIADIGVEAWDVGKSTSFLSTGFVGGYRVDSDCTLHSTIDWQIRYLSPIHEHGTQTNGQCLFSKRQAATLKHTSGITVLQEKRAVVSLRVLREAPELFSILVVKDDDTLPDTDNPDQQFDVDMFWKGYGFVDPNDVSPITYYLLEICRVFKMCMDAWGKTLSTIDKLVLVKLEDLDDGEKVEALMFDNSFERSKDYFVASQVLRIIDEWLDEVQSAVEDMSKDPVLLQASMWADKHGSDRSFEVAIRYVNEHATAIKSRVRMKHEEINSLRDGLFNATSLRESTKAMALNQAIYVFTVVTVLFTPVSFLATFWALPFLNNPAEGSETIPEPSAFRNSFIIMPLLTYALVIGVAWFVGRRNSTRVLLGLLKDYWEILQILMASAWSSLPRMPWR